MKKIYCLVIVFVGIAMLFLFFTNPTASDFRKDFQYYMPPPKDTDLTNYVDPHLIVRRDRNYFLCSHFIWANVKVLGIAGNFFIIEKIPGKHTVVSQGGQVKFDGFVVDSNNKTQ